MLEEKRKKLMITADDFGKSQLANRNILKLAKAGNLDRVSVMSDGIFAPGEIEELISSGVKLDIHLELDWQKKRRGRLKDNTARQGIIFLMNHFRSGRGKIIQENWKRQIEKFCELAGRYPDGINSHEYVHYFPAYFRTALKLADLFKISYIRFGKSGFTGEKNVAHLILNKLRQWDMKNYLASKLETADYFVSLDWIGSFDEFLSNCPEGKTEIACHPEREDEFEAIEKYF